MSTSMRFKAAIACVILTSATLGFAVATTVISAGESNHYEVSNGPRVASPGSMTRANTETRTIAGLKNVKLAMRSISAGNFPAMNPQGPEPGMAHANPGATRSIASACLLAMN